VRQLFRIAASRVRHLGIEAGIVCSTFQVGGHSNPANVRSPADRMKSPLRQLASERDPPAVEDVASSMNGVMTPSFVAFNLLVWTGSVVGDSCESTIQEAGQIDDVPAVLVVPTIKGERFHVRSVREPMR